MQEIVISVMAAVARRFIHDRHADLYLDQSETILVDVKQPRNIYVVISIMMP